MSYLFLDAECVVVRISWMVREATTSSFRTSIRPHRSELGSFSRMEENRRVTRHTCPSLFRSGSRGFRLAAAGIQVRRGRIAFPFEGRNLDYNLFLIVGNTGLLLCRARFPFERR